MAEKRINSERPRPVHSFTLSPECTSILERVSSEKQVSRSSIVDYLIREHLTVDGERVAA